ncbi:MAG: 30S ribosomal protein S9 [Deltaproteobacteria bacterium]|nr:30S ribosomal protein S9 [Deltaproteobacteria bacterium]MBW1930539.1 30S ribosomal protein S9 [Deltaproteobacteria bacterium]MBW2026164.1 30S ribosomal protein S9 [Deltaproteobacteria bacterium]MBW2126270.1 30S ribosomal protein S9 [Deltaproteobacteria bacterium]
MAQELIHATGKRKTAVARVWMRQGTGNITINNRPMEEYLARETDRVLILEPLQITETLGKLDIKINVRGGGISGQAGAIRHGISRALVSLDPELREPLKKGGFLTRDPRMKERKKYGQRGARARFQYSKR